MIEGKYKALNRTAHKLTLKFPAGTWCRYWGMAYRDGPGKEGRIRAGFSVLSSGEVVGWIEGCVGCVATTHIEVNGKPILESLEAA